MIYLSELIFVIVIFKLMVYKIGITGGIASGKSRCLQFLGELKKPKVYTLNLDLFANTVYKHNPYALRNI